MQPDLLVSRFRDRSYRNRFLIDSYTIVPLLRFLSFSTQNTGFPFNWRTKVSIPLLQNIPVRREPRSEGFAVDFKGFAFPSADFVIHRADPPFCAAGISSPTHDAGLCANNVTVTPMSLDATPRITRCPTSSTNFTPS